MRDAGLIRFAGLVALVTALAAGCSGGDDAAGPLDAPSKPPRSATELRDVAARVGLDFRHGAFRWGVERDVVAMMGTGLCWLDADGDARLDLFVVNSYAEAEAARWREEAGGLPVTAFYRNLGGRFEEVAEAAGAAHAVRGTGCVAADLDADGDTDLYVTTATDNLLLWNDGRGRFTEGAREAGVGAYGWSSGAAVGDLNGDGRPDLVVAGYADVNNRDPGARGGFPGTFLGVRDLLFVNEGGGADGGVTFREVGVEAGLEVGRLDHGLGVVLTDVDVDGDLDVYLANDTEPNRLYRNVPWPGGTAADPDGIGFRLEELGAAAGVADPNAGMGVASGDYDGDGRPDLFVTNLRNQVHGVFRSGPPGGEVPSFSDEREAFGPGLGDATGWGVSWADLDLDTDLDVLLVNGHVPLTDLVADAEPPLAFENLAADGKTGRFRTWSAALGLDTIAPRNARGSAVADYDDDGDLDVAINAIGGPLVLLENRGEGGRWLEVALDGVYPGARVTATLPDGTALVREVQAGSSYLSSEDPRVHFGLGVADRVRELRVDWPDGGVTTLDDVAVNRRVEVAVP